MTAAGGLGTGVDRPRPHTWYLGLDVARVRDLTSLALVEGHGDRLALTGLKTWRPERDDCLDALPVVVDVARRAPGRVAVAIDGRGIGKDVATAAASGTLATVAAVYPILPSASDRPHRMKDDGWTFVGKDGLVARLRSGMESGRLVIARGLEEAEALRGELAALVRIPSRRGRAETWGTPDQKAGSHDDRVMAVAYALWLAETLREMPWTLRRRAAVGGGAA